MSHALYHTDGFVVGVRDSGESNRILSLYTRELGLVRAAAQGIRDAKSKLRYSLSLFSHSRISLVRGREYWRITGAYELTPRLGSTEARRLGLLARWASLILRVVQGGERDDELYEEILFLKDAVGSCEPRDEKELELLGVIRVLYHLGYIAGDSDIEFVCGAPVPLPELLFFVRQRYSALLAAANRSLSYTQL